MSTTTPFPHPICMVSDCYRSTYLQPPSCNYCIYHYQLLLSTRIPAVCITPFCFNKCKVYGHHSTCVKHTKYSSACCTSRCRSMCAEGSYACFKHLEYNYCTVKDCSNLETSVGVPRCPKHVEESTICCFENCLSHSTPFTSFCTHHYKSHRLCGTHGCFSPIFRHEYCCRHLNDPRACFALKCRNTRSSLDGLCLYHSRWYVDYTPHTSMFENLGDLLDEPIPHSLEYGPLFDNLTPL